MDTKMMLSDHIKKHIRAVRNTVGSPKTEKLASKSCSKVVKDAGLEESQIIGPKNHLN